MVDMYRGIIQHRDYVTEYLRDQILGRKLEGPTRHGRIYRIVHDTTRRDRKPVLSTESPAALVDRLAHPNGWWRDTAQRLLVERGDRSVVPALEEAAAAANDPRTDLHALWTLEGLDALSVDTTLRALKDPARDVRVSAIRLAEPWLREPDDRVRGAVVSHLTDPDWAVRRQLSASIGESCRER